MFKWMRRVKALYVPPMVAGRLLECFRVQLDNPLLQGVLHELRGLHEIAAQNAEVLDQPDSVTLKYTAMMRAYREAEERILDMVTKNLKPRSARGRKQTLEEVKGSRPSEQVEKGVANDT